MLPEQGEGSLGKTLGHANALSLMQHNSLRYSSTELNTLNVDALRHMLSVVDDVEKSLSEILGDITICESAKSVSGEQDDCTPSYYWRNGIDKVKRLMASSKDVIGGILKACGGPIDLSSDSTWSYDIASLSPKLCGCIGIMNKMYATLYNEGSSVYDSYSLSISAESAIMSLSHLTNIVHRLCHGKPSASSHQIALFNTGMRSVSVITESLRQLALLVNQEMADRIQRCTMLMAEASLLVSPFTPKCSVSDLKQCTANVVRSAKTLADAVGYTDIRNTTLIPMANGLKSIIEYATAAYINVHDGVCSRNEKGGRTAPIPYNKDLLPSHLKCNALTSDILFVRAELLEAELHASLFELRYIENSRNKKAPEDKSSSIERHVSDMKWSLMYALIGVCECSVQENSSAAVNSLIMDCASDAAHCALESLRRVVDNVDSQPFLPEDKKRALRSLGSVATLVNRTLDRLDGKRKFYSHNWDAAVSGVTLLPGELPEDSKLLKTTAQSSLDALRGEPFKVVSDPLDLAREVLRAIVAAVVRLCLWLWSLCKLCSDHIVSSMTKRSEDTSVRCCDDMSENMDCGSPFGEKYFPQGGSSGHSYSQRDHLQNNAEESPSGSATKIHSGAVLASVRERPHHPIGVVSNDEHGKSTSKHSDVAVKNNLATESEGEYLSSDSGSYSSVCGTVDNSPVSLEAGDSCSSSAGKKAKKVVSSLVVKLPHVAEVDVVEKGSSAVNGRILSQNRGI